MNPDSHQFEETRPLRGKKRRRGHTSELRRSAPTKKKRRVLVITGVLLCVLVLVAASACCSWWDPILYLPSKNNNAALTLIHHRQQQLLWKVAEPLDETWARSQLRFSPRGAYFADLDYAQTRPSRWTPIVHLDRLLGLARLEGRRSIDTNESARSVLIELLDFWLQNDFQTNGWWYRVIQVPRQLLAAGIMLEEHLSKRQKRKLSSIASRGVLHPCQAHSVRAHSGGNHLDLLHNTLSYALFRQKGFLLLKTRALVEKELSFKGKKRGRRGENGVQRDLTFFQHGPQLLAGSYGLVYVKRAVSIIELLANTSLRFSKHTEDFIIEFLLGGMRYAVHTRNSHYLANGRSFSRPNGESLVSLEDSLEALVRLSSGQQAQKLQDFLAHLQTRPGLFSSTKYFPSSFFLASHHQGTYMAVKGAHQGMINSEFLNGENPLGRNLGYGGVTAYQHTGLEYANISSVWDFSMLPGSTAYREGDEELRSKRPSAQYRSKTAHSGGGSSEEGTLGALFVDLVDGHGLLSSRQFYVTNGEGLMVCLGNSITNARTENQKPVFTTLDQTYAQNPSHDNTSLTGAHNLSAGSAVYNAAFAYYSLCSSPTPFRASVSTERGNFFRNNLNYNQTQQSRIFKVYLSHGKNPQNGSFAYAVAANQNGQAPLRASSLPITRVVNLAGVQAVQFEDGSGAVVLHEKGRSWTSASGTYSAAHVPALFFFGPENATSET